MSSEDEVMHPSAQDEAQPEEAKKSTEKPTIHVVGDKPTEAVKRHSDH